MMTKQLKAQVSASQLGGKRVVVVGLGVEGAALARFLVERGASVTVSDAKDAQAMTAQIESLRDQPVRFALGGNRWSDMVGADAIFVSPGVPLDIPALAEARARGIPFSSSTEIFFQLCPAPIVGITGSSGKTTTTSLVGEMLRRAGEHIFVGGNIGVPLLSQLSEIKPHSWVVMELSSFQLELVDRSPHLAAVTNVTPNHLDKHRSMEEYVEAKRNIVRYQRAEDFAVLNHDDPAARGMAASCPGRVVLCSLSGLEGDGAFLAAGKGVLRFQGVERVLFDASRVQLLGRHNLANTLMASAIAALCGVRDEVIAQVAAEFKGVEHRLEWVAQIQGVDYYNDSIATTPERTAAGLRAFQRPVVLIAGGRDKHLPLEVLVDEAWERCRGVVLYGEAAEGFEAAIRGGPKGAPRGARSLTVWRQRLFADAVHQAARMARSGDVVLLSPACASYDQFANFEERGREFKRLVRDMAGKE